MGAEPHVLFLPHMDKSLLLSFFFFYFWLCWVPASARGPPPAAASPPRRAGLPPSRPPPPRSTGSRRAGSAIAQAQQLRRLSNCGPRAQPLRGTRDPPRSGPEPASLALAGRPPNTAPPGKPPSSLFLTQVINSVYDFCKFI